MMTRKEIQEKIFLLEEQEEVLERELDDLREGVEHLEELLNAMDEEEEDDED